MGIAIDAVGMPSRSDASFFYTLGITMKRSELLEAAAKALGHPVPVHRLNYALRHGYVRPKTRRPDGWNAYSNDDLKDLVKFIREHSRTVPASV